MIPNIILDAHLDLAYHALEHGRSFANPTWLTRQLEGKFPGHPYDEVGVATVGLPNLLLGRVGLVFGTIWVKPMSRPYHPNTSYDSPQQAYRQAMRQLDFYQRLVDENPRIRLIRNQAELDRVLASWEEGRDFAEHVLGIVLLMEGADPILEPAQVEEWYERGLRIIGPAWEGTRYSAGTDVPGRLTALGQELLEVMAGLNMILDCSHLAHEAFYEAVDLYPGPLIASHSNPSRFAEIDRNLSDDMIRRLVERDGTIGLVLYNEFMQQGWKPRHSRKSEVPATRILDMIDHVCQIAGDALHVGIGTDWDGGFGWESIPAPLDSHLDLWGLRQGLLARNFSEADLQQIFCGNFLRILRKGLPT